MIHRSILCEIRQNNVIYAEKTSELGETLEAIYRGYTHPFSVPSVAFDLWGWSEHSEISMKSIWCTFQELKNK